MSLRSFRLQADVVRMLAQLAEKAQRSGNWIANEALREYFSRQQQEGGWKKALESFEAARGKLTGGKEALTLIQEWFLEKKNAFSVPGGSARSLEALWRRGVEFLGCRAAIMGGAMSWVSDRHLVSALSNAGAFGVIACGSMPPALLEKEIIETRKLTDRPFGVNLIIMHPELDALIKVCRTQKVSHVVLAGGIPKAQTVEAVKSYGAKVMCFAPSLAIARKLIKLGADALIIEGMEAGGHIGPVATSVLAQEILPAIREVPVFVAGGIGRGEAIAGYLEMGASGVQLGTRFVCSTQSIAHPKFKQLFIRSSARDAVPSVQVDSEFPVIPVRAIENKATETFIRFQQEVIARYKKGELTKKEAQLQIEHFWAGALRRAVIDGDIENGSVMAGQSVGMITRIEPVEDIIAELVAQAEGHLAHAYAA
jgi:enoyl-[acyl-carrier protein] reductase II